MDILRAEGEVVVIGDGRLQDLFAEQLICSEDHVVIVPLEVAGRNDLIVLTDDDVGPVMKVFTPQKNALQGHGNVQVNGAEKLVLVIERVPDSDQDLLFSRGFMQSFPSGLRAGVAYCHSGFSSIAAFHIN